MMLVALVHAWVLPHSSNGSICTSRFASVITNTIPSDFGSIFVYLAKHTRRAFVFHLKLSRLVPCHPCFCVILVDY